MIIEEPDEDEYGPVDGRAEQRAEDQVIVAADTYRNVRHAQEAEPLRTFCVTFNDGEETQEVTAHQMRGRDGLYLGSLFSTVRDTDIWWVRFVVYRNGRDDIVAQFREADVKAVYEVYHADGGPF